MDVQALSGSVGRRYKHTLDWKFAEAHAESEACHGEEGALPSVAYSCGLQSVAVLTLDKQT